MTLEWLEADPTCRHKPKLWMTLMRLPIQKLLLARGVHRLPQDDEH
jgi:hypothetical protein